MCSQNTETWLLFIQAAKRHLTQRIEKLDDKLDQQKALSGQIRDDVPFPLINMTQYGSAYSISMLSLL
jgi:hypothetical protein